MRAVFLFPLLHLSHALQIVVPAYWGTDTKAELNYWNQLVTSAPKVPLTIIINPNDGPDARASDVDQSLVSYVKQLRTKGAKIIGYVASNNGKRNLTKVYGDVDKYISFYPIDGIFVDEMSDAHSATNALYYKNIYNYIKGKNSGYQVMNNPGTTVPESLVSSKVADSFCTYESPQTDYHSYEEESYHNKYPASTYIHIVYGATADQMTTDVKFMVSKKIGGLYISNDVLPNPYDTLPSYWDQLVSTVASYNGSG